MDIRRFPDPTATVIVIDVVVAVGIIRENTLFALMAFLAAAVLGSGVHGDHLVGFGPLVALRGAVGSGRHGRHSAAHSHEQGAEGGKAAEDEHEPTFHQAPDDEIVDAV